MSPILKNSFQITPPRKKVLFLFVFLAAVLTMGPTWAATEPVKNEVLPARQLTGVRLGTMPEYSRLVFAFSQPIGSYAVRRANLDEFWINFGPIEAKKTGRLTLKDPLVAGVALIKEDNRLLAKVKLTTPMWKFRHYAGPDGLLVTVDLRPEMETRPPADQAGKPEKKPLGPLIEIPTLKESALKFRAGLPRKIKADSPEALLAQGVELAYSGKYEAAIGTLSQYKDQNPESPFMADLNLLLADCHFAFPDSEFAPHFLPATSLYQVAIAADPDSPRAARNNLMMGLSYQRMGNLKPAVGYYNILQKQFPDSGAAIIGQAKLAEIYMELGKRSLAKTTLEAVMEKRPRGEMIHDAFYKLGQGYFKEGLYSEAGEMFDLILDQNPEYYLKKPDILYFMGESYYNLSRPDLSRAFLYHSLNINPQGPQTDIILARIGDTYKDEGRDQKAIEIYSMVGRLFPGSSGALISRMRLADYGALGAIIPRDRLFQELESGAHTATIKLYQGFIESASDSPLVQLAIFRIGMAYLNQGQNKEAIKIFKDMIMKFSRSSLKQDALLALNRALTARMKDLSEQQDDLGVIALYKQYNHLVTQEDLPLFRHFAARSFAGIGLGAKAINLWEANQGLGVAEPDRLFGLGRVFFEMGKNKESINNLSELVEKFPSDPNVPPALVLLARAEMNQNSYETALSHLKKAITVQPDLADDPKVLKLLARLFIESGDTKAGAETLSKYVAGLEKKKASGDLLFKGYAQLGLVYAESGQNELASRTLDQAMEHWTQGKYPETLYLVGSAYRKAGLKEKGEKTYQLLEKSPDPFWRDAAVEELAALNPNKKVTNLLDKPN